MRSFAMAWALWGCVSPPTDGLGDNPTPTGGDSGTTPPQNTDPRLRAVHAGATVPSQDMFGNGNAGRPPLADLGFRSTWPSSGWASRPAGEIEFSFHDHEDETAWTMFDHTLEESTSTSVVIFGTEAEPMVMLVEDGTQDVPSDKARIRWTHAAPSIGTVTLQDAVEDATYNGGGALAFGETAEFDEDPAEVTLWVDLDDNGECDPGEVFQPFSREQSDYFHVILAEDADGVPFLLGHTRSGGAPTRDVTDSCP